jgi:two-component system, OmpR family, alkaline phosphatase synthesis response regulator PhoP
MAKTILVVEDYDDWREMIKFFLEQKGHKVIEAANGLEAVKYAKAYLPDLILMDIYMPELDGLSALEQIKKSADTALIPVICVTAMNDFYRTLAKDAGCVEFLEKPVDIQHLLKTINDLLN